MKNGWQSYLKKECLISEDRNHSIKMVFEQIVKLLSERQGTNNLKIIHPPKVVTIGDNFDLMLFPKGAKVRSSFHTIYVNESCVLISQMSTAVATWIRDNYHGGDCLVLCPGLVYRRTGTHHQLDIWRLSVSTTQPLIDKATSEALAIINHIIHHVPIVKKPKNLPYVNDGFKLIGTIKGKPMTLVSGGNLHPQFLININLDPAIYSGYALGFGLGRLVMAIKGIDDDSIVDSTDPRISSQMTNLSPYVPVSRYPSIQRDLSIAVPISLTSADITARLINFLGPDYELVENITIISEVDYGSLPSQAIERLDMLPGQKNVLLRITLRSFNRTLSHGEANDLCRRIYRSMHAGNRGYLT